LPFFFLVPLSAMSAPRANQSFKQRITSRPCGLGFLHRLLRREDVE
jgi:hypothetical protein